MLSESRLPSLRARLPIDRDNHRATTPLHSPFFPYTSSLSATQNTTMTFRAKPSLDGRRPRLRIAHCEHAGLARRLAAVETGFRAVPHVVGRHAAATKCRKCRKSRLRLMGGDKGLADEGDGSQAAQARLGGSLSFHSALSQLSLRDRRPWAANQFARCCARLQRWACAALSPS